MRRAVFQFLIFAVSLCSQSGFGTALRIDIAPSQVSDGVTGQDVVISCRLDDVEDDAVELMLLKVDKGDKLVALVREDSTTTSGKGFENKLKIESNISKVAVADSYFRVTVMNAGKDDAGVYVCKSYYMTIGGQIKGSQMAAAITVVYQKTTTTSTTITTAATTNEDTSGVAKYLLEKLSLLETELLAYKNDTKNTLEQLKKEHKEKETEFQSHISQLNDRITAQEAALTRSEERGNNTIFFAADHSTKEQLKKGHVLIFDDVVINEGQGYDNNTGVFTAPVRGYFYFNLKLFAHQDDYLHLELVSSNNQTLAKAYDGSRGWEGFTDSSCVAKLQAGERVWPKIGGHSRFFQLKSYGNYNHFSGYLLKAF